VYQDLLELMKGRRSVRRFRDRPVPEAMVEQLLEAARWAPSAGNRQAWRFLLVRGEDKRAELREIVATALRDLRQELRGDLADDVERYLENFTHFAGAPLVVVPIFRSVDLLQASVDDDKTMQTRRAELDALSSVAAAVQNLLLAAHSLGLGACWMSGPLLAEAELERALAVPEGWRLAAVIPVGYPDEQPAPASRRALTRLYRNVDSEGTT